MKAGSELPSELDSQLPGNDDEDDVKDDDDDEVKVKGEPQPEARAEKLAPAPVLAGGGGPSGIGGENLVSVLAKNGIAEPVRSELARLAGVTAEMVEYHCRNAPSVGAAIYRIRNLWEVGQNDFKPRERAGRTGYRREDLAPFIEH